MKPVDGGNRRVDRVLAADFLDGLTEWSMDELRARRKEAEQEEADLSYIRRMLQGRIDIIAAEIRRRDTGTPGVVEILSEVLADTDPLPRSVRHISVEPSRVGEVRRAEERAASDVLTLDVEQRNDAELLENVRALKAHELDVSKVRSEVQQVADALSAEVARRYRDGSASVDALLGEHL